MFPVKDSFSIVLNGAWNPSVFNQTWILNNLANDADTEVSIAYPVDDATAPRKISFENLNIYPGRKQLILSPERTDLAGMRSCADKLARILNLLVHTPVGGCGINFNFLEKIKLEDLQEVLNSSDRKAIDFDKYTLAASSVSRKFETDGDFNMNLIVSDHPNGISLKFNFHNDVDRIDAVSEQVTANFIEEKYNQAIEFCRDVYNLEIEEGVDDED